MEIKKTLQKILNTKWAKEGNYKSSLKNAVRYFQENKSKIRWVNADGYATKSSGYIAIWVGYGSWEGTVAFGRLYPNGNFEWNHMRNK